MRVVFSLMLLSVVAVAVTGCVTPPPAEVAITHATAWRQEPNGGASGREEAGQDGAAEAHGSSEEIHSNPHAATAQPDAVKHR